MNSFETLAARKVFDVPVEVKLPDNSIFTGTFVLQYPTVAERIKIGLLTAQQRNGIAADQIDEYTNLLTLALATLQVLCVKFPVAVPEGGGAAYLAGLEPVIILAVYEEYYKKMTFFREGDAGKSSTNT